MPFNKHPPHFRLILYCSSLFTINGLGSTVDIATGYGLDGPGIEYRWGEIFRIFPDRSWGPTILLYNGYPVFSGGKKRPGRDADPSPPSSAVVMNEYSYTSTLPVGRTACTEPQCLYKGALYLFLPMNAYGGVEVQLHMFLNQALDEGECSYSNPGSSSLEDWGSG